ncbi:response regulator [Vibrio gazogenes]|uniref:DNA-binding response regulator n=1 Tax=Vibrio gazogenes TaxID=687 RepID=A0A1Z2SIP3_VIBGA|nr:response regulator [Vibrio gazogenes]ASA57053.1 DNA-binding response regulator [Vibrio gazogenes]
MDILSNKTIVVVEDDIELAVLMKDFLSRYNFNVVLVDNGIDAVKTILNIDPDLVILDILLPGMNGMEVCKSIRHQYQGFILMQTALEDDIDQVMGLEIGADDYVVKQVQPKLLLSRIHALLRCAQRGCAAKEAPKKMVSNESDYQFGPLRISLVSRSVTLHQTSVDLTSAEFELLVLLAQSIGEVVSRDEMIHRLRGFEYDGLDRSIDRRVSRLRKKIQLENGDDLIKTVRGVGYQLCIYSE